MFLAILIHSLLSRKADSRLDLGSSGGVSRSDSALHRRPHPREWFFDCINALLEPHLSPANQDENEPMVRTALSTFQDAIPCSSGTRSKSPGGSQPHSAVLGWDDRRHCSIPAPHITTTTPSPHFIPFYWSMVYLSRFVHRIIVEADLKTTASQVSWPKANTTEIVIISERS